ncbi:MAG TPA: TolC family protein [Gemmatimonadaceae bacterium]
MSSDIAVFGRADRTVPSAGALTVVVLGLFALSLIARPVQAQGIPVTGADTSLAVRVDTVIDLPTAISRALDVSPIIAASEGSVRNAQSEQRVANGAYVPTLAATSSLLRSNVTTVPTGSLPNSYSAGLASSVDVFTGGRRGADKDRATADMRSAEVVDISQRFSVTLATQRAFYDNLRANDLVDVAKARVAQGERGLRYATARIRAGTTTKSDELRARLELTSGQQQLVAALDTLSTTAYSLGRLVGSNGPVGAQHSADEAPRALVLSDSEVVRLAIQSSPSVRAANAADEANRALTRSARATYVPGLRVTGGYNWANQTTLVGGVHPGWSVALGSSYPLFNGFQREDAVTRADVAAEVSRVNSLDVTRQTRAEAARLLAGLRFADRNISLAQEAVKSAQEDLRVQNERYQAGISTELDQLTSELALTQTQLSLVAARFNYSITRAQLEALVGRQL